MAASVRVLHKADVPKATFFVDIACEMTRCKDRGAPFPSNVNSAPRFSDRLTAQCFFSGLRSAYRKWQTLLHHFRQKSYRG